MGQGSRKHLFVYLLKDILKVRDVKIGHQQLCEFLEFEHLPIDTLKFRGTNEGQQLLLQFLNV